jgi:transcription elongation factor Elf1
VTNYLLYAKLATYLLKKLKPSERKHHIWVECPYCSFEQLITVKLKNEINFHICKCENTFKIKLDIRAGKLNEEYSQVTAIKIW